MFLEMITILCTGIRDTYILWTCLSYVVKALDFIDKNNLEIFNIGTGKGGVFYN